MNFEKLPKEIHARVIELYENKEYRQLLIIHNEYKLSAYNYTCCGIDGLITWIKYGIETGEIKAN